MKSIAEWLRNVLSDDKIELLIATQAAELAARQQECERLRELKTPASRELLNVTKGCLDSAEAEAEQLRSARDLLVKAMVRATGADEAAIREAPMTEAIKTAERTEKAGWEVEGFIERLTQRNDANSERLVLEAISHLRAFSRDCDALRNEGERLWSEIEQLREIADDDEIKDVHDGETLVGIRMTTVELLTGVAIGAGIGLAIAHLAGLFA